MGIKVDMTGQTYGKWTVIRLESEDRWRKDWLCRCECGLEKTVEGRLLRRGESKGCISCARKGRGNSQYRHGHAAKSNTSKTYRSWRDMLKRCSNPKVPHYNNYGGRGISVCSRWAKFENFLEDMGEKPFPTAQVDRIDVNGNYEPENCRWVTNRANANNRRNNVMLTLGEKTQSMAQWSSELNINYATLRDRKESGWSDFKALTTPVRYLGFTYKGVTKSVGDWAVELGMNQNTLAGRLRRGWSIERAFTQGIQHKSEARTKPETCKPC